LGTAFVGNQTALYIQAPAELVGVAAGLSRTLSHVGSIVSSTITGIVFSHNVTDSGMQTVGGILVAVSVAMLLLTVFDRTLKTRRPSHPPS
jgi:uncharacterized membrane protein (UPF0136 family)